MVFCMDNLIVFTDLEPPSFLPPCTCHLCVFSTVFSPSVVLLKSLWSTRLVYVVVVVASLVLVWTLDLHIFLLESMGLLPCSCSPMPCTRSFPFPPSFCSSPPSSSWEPFQLSMRSKYHTRTQSELLL